MLHGVVVAIVVVAVVAAVVAAAVATAVVVAVIADMVVAGTSNSSKSSMRRLQKNNSCRSV